MGDDIHGLSVHCARCGENFGKEGFRHGGKKANFLFPDGHAKSIKKKNLTDLLWADNTTFPNNCE
jgi:prepilin-type processing-associated H-X9-DG protein